MKKLLALVLALVMTLGLAMIGTNAAFKDADKISYTEAVDVMALVGVLKGDENGNFNPADTIHRDAAAKIIAYLVLGDGDTADAIPGDNTFSDVAANNWAAGYIAYCASEGIINGDGLGHFFPANNVTGYEFGKMLLVALGYNAQVDGLTGENWKVNTAKLMKDKNIMAGISGSASKAITREEAAQMAFNTLKAVWVEGETGSSMTIGGVPVTTGGTKAKDNSANEKLYEKLYSGLKFKNGSDEFGRTTNEWTLGKNKVVAMADDADLSYTGVVSGKTLLEDLGLKSTASIKKENISIIRNGAAAASVDVDKNTKDVFNSLHSKVELYVVGEGKYEVIVVEYKIGEVTAVDTSKGTITVDGKTFETKDYKKGDKVLYTVADGEIQSVETPNSVQGKVTKVVGTKSTIDGTAYTAEAGKAPIGAKGTFYLSVDNIIVESAEDNVEAPEELYAYVYSIVKKAGSTTIDENGFPVTTGDTYTAYFVDTDGVTGKAVLAKDTLKDGDEGVYQYTLTAKDEFKPVGTKIGWTKVTVNKDTKKIGSDFLSSATEFVFVDADKGNAKLTVSHKTGYKTVDIKNENAVAIANKGKVITVFVEAKEAEPESDALYAFLLNKTPEQTLDANDKIVYSYSVFADGKKTTLVGDKDTFNSFAKNDYFEYTLKSGKIESVTKKAADVKGASYVETIDDYIVYGTEKSTADLASGCAIYDGTSSFASATLKKGDTIDLYKNSKGLVTTIVITAHAE